VTSSVTPELVDPLAGLPPELLLELPPQADSVPIKASKQPNEVNPEE
jgi:hypothetical protein